MTMKAEAEKQFGEIGARLDQWAKQRAALDAMISRGRDEQLILKGKIDALSALVQQPVAQLDGGRADKKPKN